MAVVLASGAEEGTWAGLDLRDWAPIRDMVHAGGAEAVVMGVRGNRVGLGSVLVSQETGLMNVSFPGPYGARVVVIREVGV